MSIKPNKNNSESESLQEQIIKLEKQLESFKHSNDHFLKNKLFLHYDIKEPEKVVVDCESRLPVLAEIDKKKIQKGQETDPTHLLIEGDNYHALSVLNYTHAGKVDLIYIDPPYNTGANDWKYNNDYVDAEDSFRHSKWLSFMERRIRLAKKLMTDDGVLVLTIDDYEIFTIGLLLNQIFGEENRIGILAMEINPRGRTTNKFFATSHEYVLFYAKNSEKALVYNRPLTEEQAGAFALSDDISAYRFLPFRRSGGLSTPEERPNSYYPIYYIEKDNYISIEKRKGAVEIFPIDSTGRKRVWRQTRPSLMEAVKRGDMVIRKGRNGYTVLMKDRIKDGRKPKTIWVDPAYDASSHGTVLLQKILGKRKVFDYPKSINAVIDVLSVLISEKKNATVLDFFAGSGTTGHAVLKINAQDGGTRKFILCTNNENKIAENVTYPRIKKVIDGYGDTAGIPANLRYFQTDFVEKKGSASQLKIDLTRQCAEMLCVKENVFEAVKLNKQAKNYKFFKNGDKYLGVFFDFFTDAEFASFIKELNALPKEAEKAVYVFVLDGSAGILADEFSGVANCEVKEIPQKILDIYKQLAREVARK